MTMSAKGSPTESNGFTAAERAAMKQRAAELRGEGKTGVRKADDLQAVLDIIDKMAAEDRALAERVHATLIACAPQLSPHRVSWSTVQRAVVAWGGVELVEPQPTGVLGMDETRFGRPRWLSDGRHDDGRIRWVRTDPWETGFIDITGEQAPLGQVDGRSSAAVRAWLTARTAEFRAGVEVVVIDPHAGYAAAVRAALPDAAIAVDHFHLIMLANKAVTAVRQRVTRDLLGRRGRKLDPAWANRRLLLRGRGAAVRACAGPDVERLRRSRPIRPDPHRVDRQGRTASAVRGGHPARSVSGSTRSTAGAPMRRSPS